MPSSRSSAKLSGRPAACRRRLSRRTCWASTGVITVLSLPGEIGGLPGAAGVAAAAADRQRDRVARDGQRSGVVAEAGIDTVLVDVHRAGHDHVLGTGAWRTRPALEQIGRAH